MKHHRSVGWNTRAAAFALLPLLAATVPVQSQSSVPSDIAVARQALVEKHFDRAKALFAAIVKSHSDSTDGRLGLADAELGLHEYETAELEYRRVVALQPELWIAHKNLVIVEAALGRWDEFDRERAILRSARDRRAPGISRGDADVIDSFVVRGQRWIVREYYEPAGRTLARYNFESFGPDGHIREYISLESAEEAKQIAPGGSIAIGRDSPAIAAIKTYALNWYTGRAHGSITTYPDGEPPYEKVRKAVLRFLRRQE